MGYYYNPPPPTQAVVHTPIPAQGDPPPRRTWVSLYQVRATWPEPTWPAQSEPDSASFNVALVVQPPFNALASFYAQRNAWSEPTWSAQYAPRVAPLTLVYGDQPPRLNPPQPVWPQPIWAAQSAQPNAGWNVPAPLVQSVSPSPPQWQLWQSWQTTPQPTQRAITQVQPSTGDQPSPHSIYLQMAVRNLWPEFMWPSQSAAPTAGWNFTPAQVDNPPPLPQVLWQIWASWNIPPQPVQGTPIQVLDNTLPPPIVNPQTFSGGFLLAYELEQVRRARKRRELEELAEDSARIEDDTSRQIAAFLREQEARDAEQADAHRLHELALRYAREKDSKELSDRVKIAYVRALSQANFSALEAFQRELDRMLEEEEIAALTILFNED
ncbi:MAG TPA: hypothetical protein VK626_01615 [Nitrospiraceae bacterium]|nr:hypothetical protein [Nitrospiraceae bacterium]